MYELVMVSMNIILRIETITLPRSTQVLSQAWMRHWRDARTIWLRHVCTSYSWEEICTRVKYICVRDSTVGL